MKEKKPLSACQRRCGLVVVSLAFFLVFCCFFPLSSRLTTVFKDLNYTNFGAYSLAALNLPFAIFSFLAPSIIRKTGHFCAFFLGAFCYCLFALCCLLPAAKAVYAPDSRSFYFSATAIYSATFTGAVLNGMGAALIWVSQGSYISEIAPPLSIGRYMGFFQFFHSLAMVGSRAQPLSQIVGPLIVGLAYDGPFNFFILLAAFGASGTLSFCCLPRMASQRVPPRQKLEGGPSSARGLASDISSSSVLPPGTPQLHRPQQRQPKFCRICFSAHMLRLWPSFIHMGLDLGFFTIFLSDSAATLAREDGHSQVEANRLSSLMVLAVGTFQCVCGPLSGKLIDKYGLRGAVALRYSLGVLSYSSTLFAFRQGGLNLWIYISAGLFGCFTAFQKTTNSSIGGTQFPSKQVPFAVLRLLASLGTTFTALVAPLCFQPLRRQLFTAAHIAFFILSEVLVLRSQTLFRQSVKAGKRGDQEQQKQQQHN